MNKKQLTALTHSIVLSVRCSINDNEPNENEHVTEDEARTLVGIALRSKTREIIGAATCNGGIEVDEDRLTIVPVARPKKKEHKDAALFTAAPPTRYQGDEDETADDETTEVVDS